MERDHIKSLEKCKNMREAIFFQIQSLFSWSDYYTSPTPTKEDLELENTLQLQSNFYSL